MSHPRLTIALLASAAFLALLTAAWPLSRIHVAREVAVWRWGNLCDGHVAILNEPLRPPLLDWTTGCTIRLNSQHNFAWWDLCYVVTHAYGHVAGYRARRPYIDEHGKPDIAHSRDPRSLMFPYVWRPYPPCGPDHNHPRFGR